MQTRYHVESEIKRFLLDRVNAVTLRQYGSFIDSNNNQVAIVGNLSEEDAKKSWHELLFVEF